LTILLLGAIVAPLASVPIVYFSSRKLRERTGYVSFALLLVPLASILIAGLLASNNSNGTYSEGYPWYPIGTFGLRADNLSIPVVFTISLLTAVIALFSIPYMHHKIGDDPERYGLYYALYSLYALGMIGTVLSTNLIQFYAFFEIMLVPSFFLIAEWGYGEREKISLMYFFWTHVGALVLLVGILVTSYLSGSTDMDVIKTLLTSNPTLISTTLRIAIAGTMCFGFFVKMAQFGLHVWLPHAHAEAPTPISALLSPAMIGIGGYATVRIVMTIYPDAFFALSAFFAGWAVITMFYGGLMAMVQDDIKRLLAYSSISQMGYILFGLASFTQLGVAGSMFQYVSHGTAKGILFIVAGSIILQVHGERSISKLGGLASRMPITTTAAFIGFLAVLGLPTTNGFLSEFFLFQGGFIRATDTATLYRIIIAVLGVIATAFTAGYSLWTIRRVFFGPTNATTSDVKEAPWTVTVPLIILSVVTIFLGIYPQPVLGPLLNAAKTIQGIPGIPGM
jgi:NADH-quinone oxidoreductase subunit M